MKSHFKKALTNASNFWAAKMMYAKDAQRSLFNDWILFTQKLCKPSPCISFPPKGLFKYFTNFSVNCNVFFFSLFCFSNKANLLVKNKLENKWRKKIKQKCKTEKTGATGLVSVYMKKRWEYPSSSVSVNWPGRKVEVF